MRSSCEALVIFSPIRSFFRSRNCQVWVQLKLLPARFPPVSKLRHQNARRGVPAHAGCKEATGATDHHGKKDPLFLPA